MDIGLYRPLEVSVIGSTVYLGYRGLEMAVSADSDADLIWLQAFLGPSYRRMEGPSASPPHRVGLHGDQAWANRRRHYSAQQAVNSQLQNVLAHVLDGEDLQLPCQPQADGSLLAWDEQFECFYRQDPEGFTTLLQAEGPPRPQRPRIALMRAVREFALHHELRSGALALHASGLAREGQAVLFAGPRRAGKTTLLSACLSLVPGLQLLANDRVMVSPHPGGWRCRGMATVVSVRAGDELLLPGLRQRLHAHALGPEAGPDELRAREFQVGDRLMLSPSQYCSGLNVAMAAECGLAAIVLPRIDPMLKGLQTLQISASASTALLAKALFGAAHPQSRSQLFDTPGSGEFPTPTGRLALVERLAQEVPCYELLLGTEAYRPDNLSLLLERVL